MCVCVCVCAGYEHLDVRGQFPFQRLHERLFALAYRPLHPVEHPEGARMLEQAFRVVRSDNHYGKGFALPCGENDSIFNAL